MLRNTCSTFVNVFKPYFNAIVYVRRPAFVCFSSLLTFFFSTIIFYVSFRRIYYNSNTFIVMECRWILCASLTSFIYWNICRNTIFIRHRIYINVTITIAFIDWLLCGTYFPIRYVLLQFSITFTYLLLPHFATFPFSYNLIYVSVSMLVPFPNFNIFFLNIS